MGLSLTIYSNDPTVFAVDGVKAGDAAEMETRLEALLASSATPANASDLVLAGVEEGPAWEACVSFGAGPVVFGRDAMRVAAGVGTSAEEAVLHVKKRIVAINDAVAPAQFVEGMIKLELAGNGVGESVMAVALLALGAA